jgi:hypothetical protein
MFHTIDTFENSLKNWLTLIKGEVGRLIESLNSFRTPLATRINKFQIPNHNSPICARRKLLWKQREAWVSNNRFSRSPSIFHWIDFCFTLPSSFFISAIISYHIISYHIISCHIKWGSTKREQDKTRQDKTRQDRTEQNRPNPSDF